MLLLLTVMEHLFLNWPVEFHVNLYNVSNSVARKKVADQFSALYSRPLSKYKRLKLEKILILHF